MKMEEFISQEKMSFEDNLAKMKEGISAITVDFTNLSQFILSLLSINSHTTSNILESDNFDMTIIKNKPVIYMY